MCVEHKTVRMVKSLLGFADIYDYQLKPVPGNPMFFWLESKGGPNFLLTRPGIFFDDYKVEVKKDTLGDLAAEDTEIQVYTIVTVPEQPAEMTTNLLAPLLINEEQGLGCQVVLYDSGYTTRHHLFPPEKRRNCG